MYIYLSYSWHMASFITGVSITVVAGIILWIIGIGRGVKVSVHGNHAKKTGKTMVLIAWAMMILGVCLGGLHTLPHGGWDMSQSSSIYGLASLELGGILLIIGSLVAWYQKL